jgi:hypothetical protein
MSSEFKSKVSNTLHAVFSVHTIFTCIHICTPLLVPSQIRPAAHLFGLLSAAYIDRNLRLFKQSAHSYRAKMAADKRRVATEWFQYALLAIMHLHRSYLSDFLSVCVHSQPLG